HDRAGFGIFVFEETHNRCSLESPYCGNDAAKIEAESLSGSPNSGVEQFGQVKWQPAIERCRHAARKKDHPEELRAIGIVELEKRHRRQERAHAKQGVR